MNIRYCMTVFVFTFATIGSVCSAETTQNKVKDEEVRIIPEDLYRYAKEQGCSQVLDFYREREGIREPPYVYGVLSASTQGADNDFSSAFWCERPERGDKKYVLLLKLDGRQWPGGCPNVIEDQDFAGGLSVIRNLNEPLAWYWNMKDRKRFGKPGQKTLGPGIQSIYDGTGVRYYCYQGTWIANTFD